MLPPDHILRRSPCATGPSEREASAERKGIEVSLVGRPENLIVSETLSRQLHQLNGATNLVGARLDGILKPGSAFSISAVAQAYAISD